MPTLPSWVAKTIVRSLLSLNYDVCANKYPGCDRMHRLCAGWSKRNILHLIGPSRVEADDGNITECFKVGIDTSLWECLCPFYRLQPTTRAFESDHSLQTEVTANKRHRQIDVLLRLRCSTAVVPTPGPLRLYVLKRGGVVILPPLAAFLCPPRGVTRTSGIATTTEPLNNASIPSTSSYSTLTTSVSRFL